MNTESKSEIRNQKSKILYLFTRTPLHVGAGASVGAIDQPIQRERHTGFPIIPATSLKGTFADAWNEGLHEQNGKRYLRVTTRKNEKNEEVIDQVAEAAWLFGSDNASHAFAGSLQFSEARLLAFPIRSAKGSFAWITCPLMLQRAVRDGVLASALIQGLPEPKDEQAIFDAGSASKLDLSGQIVLEEYTFKHSNWQGLAELGKRMSDLLSGDLVWAEVKDHLVIVSNGMMSFFAQNACAVAQHVRISDETGTAEGGALFNQENVPSETFFYSLIHAFDERTADKAKDQRRDAAKAIEAFGGKAADRKVFQFGGDASTGLGYCTVLLKAPCSNAKSPQS
ncbi:MAG: type III-B CRISPR module RAMP protein Cmr4 [Verrucomicrobia bacterium]|nr:type III-B CRISPR module RAMP protein Cmr4 [Verrucomicrobiota bacterium]